MIWGAGAGSGSGTAAAATGAGALLSGATVSLSGVASIGAAGAATGAVSGSSGTACWAKAMLLNNVKIAARLHRFPITPPPYLFWTLR
ncbi:hypothetical protein AUC69_06190 [Methyloceanibacter superfactus]|uniref:Uncharacterized protein n=1 Tax=Methyloceanibacter superfactus TaxID=1774969 RepID=A0A1E3W7N7_9HYPH|nr:hypothetical protein AUC69_06190 [Methyloceanibacter superfactus]